MAAAFSLPPAEVAADPRAEQRLLIHGVSWKDYLILRNVLDGPSPRITYSAGTVELMSPSSTHEVWKKNIARLLELYAFIKNLDLRGYGSTTFKNEELQRALEPDECYVVGRPLAEIPDFVIEVIYSNPLLDKLTVYASLGVQEVWVFRGGKFIVHRRDAKTGAYEAHPESALVPGLDFALLARYVLRDDGIVALKEFEAEVR